MPMTRRFVDALIKKGWEPYISADWMVIGSKPRGGVVITFKGHEQHEYKCSRKIAREILSR